MDFFATVRVADRVVIHFGRDSGPAPHPDEPAIKYFEITEAEYSLISTSTSGLHHPMIQPPLPKFKRRANGTLETTTDPRQIIRFTATGAKKEVVTAIVGDADPVVKVEILNHDMTVDTSVNGDENVELDHGHRLVLAFVNGVASMGVEAHQRFELPRIRATRQYRVHGLGLRVRVKARKLGNLRR